MQAVSDNRRVLIVAGEASGDLHGANLIRAARDIDPGLCFFGMGGKLMADAGCDVRIDMRELAVMGLLEVATKLPVIRRTFKLIKSWFSGPERPDLLLLVDYPGLNLRLAKAAKLAGIPVLYYICPKIWASRPGRIHQIVRDVDRLATIFPFEPALFKGEPIQVDYVGNPLLDEYHVPLSKEDVLVDQGLDPEAPVIGLFPGSRKAELKYILPTILETAEKLHDAAPETQFLLPVAATISFSEMESLVSHCRFPISLVQGDIYNLAGACDVVLAVSGTVTLQIALAGTPMVILYKASAITYAIANRLVCIPFVGLPNIVSGREVVPEFIQDRATPDNLQNEITCLLSDADYRHEMLKNLEDMKSLLGQSGGAQRIAEVLLEMLERTNDRSENL